ncbi:hypothetical protein NC653_006993 [Populus alba x Populus x berolinensis]|uniref:Uncharacterized protein n=1 Tax=Populus alba x Populus x berolinensis TaxID=444605 RepID=A0AAD6RFS5_9ROSI|nr:hypothetical protein NC653_006993 [Populus alba x Populus x berolinensis]
MTQQLCSCDVNKSVGEILPTRRHTSSLMMRRHHIKYISQLGHNTKSIPSLLKVSKSLFQIVLSSLSPLPLSHSLFHHTFKGKRHISAGRPLLFFHGFSRLFCFKS